MLNILMYILVIIAIILAIFGLFGIFLYVIIPKLRDIMKSKKDNKK